LAVVVWFASLNAEVKQQCVRAGIGETKEDKRAKAMKTQTGAIRIGLCALALVAAVAAQPQARQVPDVYYVTHCH
jgi:uncharacterized membrane protein